MSCWERNVEISSYNYVCACVQSCWLSGPVDCSPPGSSVHGIFQARILEWGAIFFSKGSSQPRNRTYVPCLSCTASRFFIAEPQGKSNNYNYRFAYFFLIVLPVLLHIFWHWVNIYIQFSTVIPFPSIFFTYSTTHISIFVCRKWGSLIQLALEQHGFQLCTSTYMQIFIKSKYCSTTQSAVDWIHRCKLQIWRASYKLYKGFCLYRGSTPLTPVLFKGQQYSLFSSANL